MALHRECAREGAEAGCASFCLILVVLLGLLQASGSELRGLLLSPEANRTNLLACRYRQHRVAGCFRRSHLAFLP